MKMRTILMSGILLTVLFSLGCATGEYDYYEPDYYPGYYPPEYHYYDYDPFQPYYFHPSERRREERLDYSHGERDENFRGERGREFQGRQPQRH